MKAWLALIQPGDWLVMLTGIGFVGISFPLFWQGGMADKAIIRQEGKIFSEVDLRARKTIEVGGPLGSTFIAIEPGRARVLSDPGPRQLCVRQGWLDKANATALCLPNHVSLQVVAGKNRHDSIGY